MMALGKAQREFSYHVSQLIQHIYAMGFQVTLGDAFRDSKSHGAMGEKGPYGRSRSAHKQRLAIDLNLFLDGNYVPHTASHKQFGIWWKALHENNRWGGDFRREDGNHYSREYNGIS
jgi:hypothetical protein